MARRAVEEFCRHSGMPSRLVDDVKLVVTEAVTNVVLHAYEDDTTVERAFDLRVHLDAGVLLVSVTDQGRGIGAPSADPGLGLGLRLALQLAGGMQTNGVGHGGGTELQLRFAVPV